MKAIAIYEVVFLPITCTCCQKEFRWLICRTFKKKKVFVNGFLDKKDAEAFRARRIEQWKKAQDNFWSFLWLRFKERLTARGFPAVPDKNLEEWIEYKDYFIFVYKTPLTQDTDVPGRIRFKNIASEQAFSWYISCCEELCRCLQSGTAPNKAEAIGITRHLIDLQPPVPEEGS